MRLKFLFFPLVLVVSVFIFIGFIWPDITVIRQLDDTMVSGNADLKAIHEKQGAIDKMGNQLTQDTSKETTVKNYLPENKMEERVIAGVNYLASDANVSLVDFSMGGQKTVTGTTDATAVNGQPVETAAIPVRTITARFSLVGDYDKIRIFLDGLAHMPIFNTIKSLEIMKQLVTKTDGTTITGTNLLATINVDFGYQDILKIKPGSLATFSPELDNDTISVLQKYVSIKSSQSIDNGSGSISGKTNPFMAN